MEATKIALVYKGTHLTRNKSTKEKHSCNLQPFQAHGSASSHHTPLEQNGSLL